MSSQAIGQRFRVSRGCCWQCVPDCRCRLAEALSFFQVAYNGSQVAEGGYTQTLKRSTDMEDTNDIPNEEQTGRLQQPAVMGWVAASDALPDGVARELLVFRQGRVEVERWAISASGKGHWWNYFGITHWMEFPPPPCP